MTPQPSTVMDVEAVESGRNVPQTWELPDEVWRRAFQYVTQEDNHGLHLRLVCKSWKKLFDGMIEDPKCHNGSRFAISLLREREVKDYMESRVGFYDHPSPGRRFYFRQSYWRDDYWPRVKELVKEYGKEIWTLTLNFGLEDDDDVSYLDIYKENLPHVLEILKGLPNLKALMLEDHHLRLFDQVEVFEFTKNYLMRKRFPRWSDLEIFKADQKIPPSMINKVLKANSEVLKTLKMCESQLEQSIHLPRLVILNLNVDNVMDLMEFKGLKSSLKILNLVKRSTSNRPYELISVLELVSNFAQKLKKLTLDFRIKSSTDQAEEIKFPNLKTLIVSDFDGESISKFPVLTELRRLHIESWDASEADKLRAEIQYNRHGLWEKLPQIETIHHVGLKDDEIGRRTLVTFARRGCSVKTMDKSTIKCINNEH